MYFQTIHSLLALIFFQLDVTSSQPPPSAGSKLNSLNTFSDLIGNQKLLPDKKTPLKKEPKIEEMMAPTEGKAPQENGEEKGSQLMIIDNTFPLRLNVFCRLTSQFARDRFCYSNLDAYIITCANNVFPLHLASFCIGFKKVCGKVNYPNEKWCDKEFHLYQKFCATKDRCGCALHTQQHCDYYNNTKNPEVDRLIQQCHCNPYQCLVNKRGLHTAEWCQRYELFCDAEKRQNEAEELSQLMDKAVIVHQQCIQFLNFANVLCNPFGPDYDAERCTKFLFDCELISNFDDEDIITKSAKWGR
uniref:GDNF domain-containing protein n=1 Tax=Rhabditophanes sp. KR3021 TaxID=114890 RepID=A0AC35U2C8_9BILA